MVGPDSFDLSEAVLYHAGAFPPATLDFGRLMLPLSRAATAIAKYDSGLRSLPNSEILLAPLRRQEAVISSRIEGTVATLDEVLLYEAGSDGAEENQLARHEIREVFSYTRALNYAQRLIADGLPISSRLIREAHSRLLFFGRGADKQPGTFKREQNYIVDRARRKVLFVPIAPELLEEGIANLERFIHREDYEPLIQTALAHLEFESLHPFKDGNGRVGRMLITLMLWDKEIISHPHFYISGHLERHKDEYIDRMRQASGEGRWTEWVLFFLNSIEAEANENLAKAQRIFALYEEMKNVFRARLASQWSINALDFIFANPVFRNSKFTSASGIPRPTAARFTRLLTDCGLLSTITQASGRRAALLSFEPLLDLVRT